MFEHSIDTKSMQAARVFLYICIRFDLNWSRLENGQDNNNKTNSQRIQNQKKGIEHALSEL